MNTIKYNLSKDFSLLYKLAIEKEQHIIIFSNKNESSHIWTDDSSIVFYQIGIVHKQSEEINKEIFLLFCKENLKGFINPYN